MQVCIDENIETLPLNSLIIHITGFPAARLSSSIWVEQSEWWKKPQQKSLKVGQRYSIVLKQSFIFESLTLRSIQDQVFK